MLLFENKIFTFYVQVALKFNLSAPSLNV